MDGLPETRKYRHLETHRIAGALGAEISGVDLSRTLTDDVMAEVRAALLDNLVIFFRDQKITPVCFPQSIRALVCSTEMNRRLP